MIQSEKKASHEQRGVYAESNGSGALFGSAAQLLAFSHELVASTTKSVAAFLAQATSIRTNASAALGGVVSARGALDIRVITAVECILVASLGVGSVNDATQNDGDDSKGFHCLVVSFVVVVLRENF